MREASYWSDRKDAYGREYIITNCLDEGVWRVQRISKNINDEQEFIYHKFVKKERAFEFYHCLIEADLDIERQIKETAQNLENNKKAGMLQ